MLDLGFVSAILPDLSLDEVLTFAQHVKGQLTLALRNPEDLSFEKDLPEVDFQLLENNLPELNRYRQQHIRLKKDL